jgi:hypothetical protein
VGAGLGEPFGVADQGVLGGFKRSSHTLIRRCWSGTSAKLGHSGDSMHNDT